MFYVRDSGDFIIKIRRMGSIRGNAILVTADVTALYPSIPQDVELKIIERGFRQKGKEKNSYWRISSNGRVCIEK